MLSNFVFMPAFVLRCHSLKQQRLKICCICSNIIPTGGQMLHFTRSPTRSTGTWQSWLNELQQWARWLTGKGVRGYIWELQSKTRHHDSFHTRTHTLLSSLLPNPRPHPGLKLIRILSGGKLEREGDALKSALHLMSGESFWHVHCAHHCEDRQDDRTEVLFVPASHNIPAPHQTYS